MITRRLSVMLLTVFFSVACLTAVAFSRQGRAKKSNRTATPQVTVKPEFLPKLPIPGAMTRLSPQHENEFLSPRELARSLPFKVVPNPRIKGGVLPQHSEAAKLISQIKQVPDYRVNHFDWLFDDEKCSLNGWGGFVEELEQTPGGFVATVRVSPTFTVNGGSAVTADYTIEKYSISNGEVKLIGGIDPPDAVPGVQLTD